MPKRMITSLSVDEVLLSHIMRVAVSAYIRMKHKLYVCIYICSFFCFFFAYRYDIKCSYLI